EHVPELRDLVELRRPQPGADHRSLGTRPLDELRTEVGAEPRLRAAPERPELEHREDASPAADPLAAVEERPPARQQDETRDRDRQRQREEEEEACEEDVERT